MVGGGVQVGKKTLIKEKGRVMSVPAAALQRKNIHPELGRRASGKATGRQTPDEFEKREILEKGGEGA